MTKTEELLAVLDLPENEQWNWLVKNNIGGLAVGEVAHLADLAFRLRDEAAIDWTNYCEAMTTIWAYWCKSTWADRKTKGEDKKHIKYRKFWMLHSQPIHWIIAALIAKELKR